MIAHVFGRKCSSSLWQGIKCDSLPYSLCRSDRSAVSSKHFAFSPCLLAARSMLVGWSIFQPAQSAKAQSSRTSRWVYTPAAFPWQFNVAHLSGQKRTFSQAPAFRFLQFVPKALHQIVKKMQVDDGGGVKRERISPPATADRLLAGNVSARSFNRLAILSTEF
jgi:hypothetical protein